MNLNGPLSQCLSIKQLTSAPGLHFEVKQALHWVGPPFGNSTTRARPRFESDGLGPPARRMGGAPRGARHGGRWALGVDH